jgi:hypothetical protein
MSAREDARAWLRGEIDRDAIDIIRALLNEPCCCGCPRGQCRGTAGVDRCHRTDHQNLLIADADNPG